MKRYATFDEYFADQPSKNRSIIRALRKFVERKAPQLEESVKWGNGCWLKGKVPVAYVYSAPDHVQFGFFAGAQLKDPKGSGRFHPRRKTLSSPACARISNPVRKPSRSGCLLTTRARALIFSVLSKHGRHWARR